MRAFITKYALTTGIIEIEGEIHNDIYFCGRDHEYGLFSKSEFFFDENEAITNAVDRRNKKIKSLTMQISKLDNMTFEIKRH